MPSSTLVDQVATLDAPRSTLNNTAASFKIADETVVAAGWMFEGPDDYQIIAVSLCRSARSTLLDQRLM